jgi:hypothetical protein
VSGAAPHPPAFPVDPPVGLLAVGRSGRAAVGDSTGSSAASIGPSVTPMCRHRRQYSFRYHRGHGFRVELSASALRLRSFEAQDQPKTLWVPRSRLSHDVRIIAHEVVEPVSM